MSARGTARSKRPRPRTAPLWLIGQGIALLLMISAALVPAPAQSQAQSQGPAQFQPGLQHQSPAQTVSSPSQASGGLAGTLTDLHSHALAGATVTLRNADTGAAVRTTTGKRGAYRFSGLAPGAYTMTAMNGAGETSSAVEVEIDPGHQAHMLAALALMAQGSVASRQTAQVSDRATPGMFAVKTYAAAGAPSAKPVFEARAASVPKTALAAVAVSLPPPAPNAVTPLPGTRSENPTAKSEPGNAVVFAEPLKPLVAEDRVSGSPAAVIAPSAAATFVLGNLTGLGASLASVASAAATRALQMQLSAPVLAAAVAADPQTSAMALTGDQLQSLPLPGRNWQNFALDSPAASAGTAADAQESSATRRTAAVTLDGAQTQLAFGGRGAGRLREASLMGGSSDTTLRAVEVESGTGEADGHASAWSRAEASTRSGTERLHGQAFLYDRQNVWGAQNPFTQWVRETAPATTTTVPAFTPFAYTPPDRQGSWGIGVGSSLRRNRLSWFAAYDGDQRNDPAVSSVKHPANFFAQPTNDEMQVLSARLALSSANPVVEGLAAYSGIMETLAGLLGPAPRNSSQTVGFGRLDWKAAERHNFTLEGAGAKLDSPDGGLTRTSETYGSHSLGGIRASDAWLLGRWEAFLTPNLLAVTQGSAGRQIMGLPAETPSAFEQSLNAGIWGQLPQMVVDSRYGFTIGNPSSFGAGSYPDEHLYEAQESIDWVRGPLLVKAGFDLRHNADSTSLLRNHTGTYNYSNLENFASDALVFAKFGLADALDPLNQHNCDQRGKAWRDASGQLHGLGYLPCYSYYTQTLGPTDWYLSTNDWAGFATTQWQPGKQLVLSTSLRWDREQLPPPIALLNNPALPLTQRLPSAGNEWEPRVGLAWGLSETRWPVVRVGYGMYFGRTSNSVLETALTQTGSLHGDLNFFMRPTDNIINNGGGAPPFPYVLAGDPGSIEKPGAVEIAPGFHNPQVHQAIASVEESLPSRVRVTASAMLSLARHLPVTMDTNFDPAVNPQTLTYAVVDGSGAGPIKTPQITVPFFASWPTTTGTDGRLDTDYQQISEIESRANSTYEAAVIQLSRNARRGLTFHARYTYAHAKDWNPNETAQVSGSSVLDPTHFDQEYGTSDLDVRHAATMMAIWQAPWKLSGHSGALANGWTLSGTGQFRSGLPYTMRTAGSITEEFETSGAVIVGLGPGMNGYGGDNRVYGVGRNTYRYPHTFKADLRAGRRLNLGHARELELFAESFNLFNHQNVTQLETTGYYIEPGSDAGSSPTLNFLTGLKTGQTEFGKPLDINATDFYRARQIDFGMRLRF